MPLDQKLLDIMACPKCHGDLDQEKNDQGDHTGLVCSACKLRFRVEDDIPIMLIDEAEAV